MAARKQAAKTKKAAPKKARKATPTPVKKPAQPEKPADAQGKGQGGHQAVAAPAPRPEPPRKGEKIELLDIIGIDTICGMIEQGLSSQEIGEMFSVSQSVVARWLAADPQRFARAREARKESAEAWMNRGMRALETAQTNVEIQRAREIAQHCRKMAAIRNPQYSDRVAIDAEVGPRQFTDEQLLSQLKSKLASAGMDTASIAGVVARYQAAKRPESVQ